MYNYNSVTEKSPGPGHSEDFIDSFLRIITFSNSWLSKQCMDVLSIFPSIVCYLSGEVCKPCYYAILKLGGMGFDDKGQAQKGWTVTFVYIGFHIILFVVGVCWCHQKESSDEKILNDTVSNFMSNSVAAIVEIKWLL